MAVVLSLMSKLRSRQHEERRIQAVIDQMRFDNSVGKQKGKWVSLGRLCQPCHQDGTPMTMDEFMALPVEIQKSYFAMMEESTPHKPKPPFLVR